MSRQKSRNALLAGNAPQGPQSQASKDDIWAMKYVMEKPSDPIYPLADKLQKSTYPDYNPWAEKDSQNSKLTAAECLNNGYFEPPSVSNEYFSARNLIQETLLSSEINGKSILQELSLNLTKAYKVRNESINKISVSSHAFRLPPRVTLTASKRDAWLRDLADPETPLREVSSKIPHGIRNKVLVDHMCTLKVPVSRAIWFVKCVLCSEQSLLRKKFHTRQNSVSSSGSSSGHFPSLDIIEGRWLQEWTSQVADYVVKFSREMPSVTTPERKTAYQAKLAYLLRLLQTLYIELLLDRTYFLQSVIRFLRDGFPFSPDQLPALIEISKTDVCDDSPALIQLLHDHPVNYGQLLTALTMVKIFWSEILQHDFLCKQLGEALLLNYFLVERIPTLSTKNGLPHALKESLLSLMQTSVVGMFRHNSNAFILPDFWLLIGGLLYRILAQSSIVGEHQQNFETVFRLINFRNESLMLNMRYTVKDGPRKLSPSPASGNRSHSKSVSGFQQAKSNVNSLNRSNEDTLMFIDQLDSMNLRSSLASSLRPTSSTASHKWRTNVKILVRWCTSAYRDMGPSVEKVLILCNYVKKKVLSPLTSRGSAHLKAEFESEIWESVFGLAHEPHATLSMHNLYVLINEFYQLKIISISSYLRKIIACGIFYISSSQSEMDPETQNDPQISFHLSILSNLPALNNKQHYQILSKWTPEGERLSSSYDRGMDISKRYVLDSLVSDRFPDDFDDYLTELRSFSVGVKFLLVSWLTSQIKATITQSPRLIHMSPSAIARIYEVYSCTDNLTVFFKSFVRFVLRNEDKVIIYYLDTLHYIGKLLQHHYLLVNFLPGSGLDRVSAAYELYNLIIYAYQDLSSREPDVYNFRPLWEFMNSSVDKRVSEAVSNSLKHVPESDKYMFSKETAESPLKVQVPTPRRNQTYSAESFAENLNSLLASAPPGANTDDIADYLQEIGSEYLKISQEELTAEPGLASRLETLARSWYSSSPRLTERQDCAFCKLIKIAHGPKDGKGAQDIARVLAAIFQDSVDHLAAFLVKLVHYGVLSFPDAVSFLRSMGEKSESAKYHHMCFELVFCGPSGRLSKSQAVMFKILQSEYQLDNVEEVFYLAVQKLKAISDTEIHSEQYGAVLRILKPVIIKHKSFALSVLATELAPDASLKFCCDLLHFSSPDLTISSLPELAPLANEFSLPFLQLLLQVVTSKEHPSESHLGKAVLEFLEICEFSIEAGNSYFGELFNYLEWDEKTKVFQFLETYFLTHKEVLTIWDEQAPHERCQVSLFSRKNSRGLELLPVFKDFFKKFSVSSIEGLDISLETFHRFSSLLGNIIELVDNAVIVKVNPRQLHDVISMFSRLLIIHSASLTDLIARHDSVHFVFLKNMMVLLNSAYLASGQDKLKILLFDLLLQMKGCLTQALVVPNEDVLANSPSATGPKNELSPGGAPLENPGGAAAVMAMSMILNLPEPGISTYDFGADDASCLVTLDTEEVHYSSDVALANDHRLVLVSKEDGVDTDEDPFNVNGSKLTRPFRMESVGLIEDTSAGVNNGCISLSMFGAYTTKENPY